MDDMRVFEIVGRGSYATYHAVVLASSEEEALSLVSKYDDTVDETGEPLDPWAPWRYMATRLTSLSPSQPGGVARIICAHGHYE